MVIGNRFNIDVHPGQDPHDHIDQRVDKTLYVIVIASLFAFMASQAHKPEGPDHFPFLVACYGIAGLRHESEIEEIDHIVLFFVPDCQIVGLDVPMNVSDTVKCLNSINGLQSNHQYSLDRKLLLLHLSHDLLQIVTNELHNEIDFVINDPIVIMLNFQRFLLWWSQG